MRHRRPSSAVDADAGDSSSTDSIESLPGKIQEGRFDEALNLLDKEIRLDSTCAELHRIRGFLLTRTGEYEASLEALNEAIRLKPDDALAYLWRADAFLHLGQYDDALLNYRKAIRQGPRDADLYLGLAECHLELGEYENALSDANEAIELDPQNGLAYWWRGKVHERDGELDLAIGDLETAIELSPNVAGTYVERGAVWFAKEDFPRAVADFGEAVRIAPDADGYRWRGAALDALEDYEKADADFDFADQFEFEKGIMPERKISIRSLLQAHFVPYLFDDLTVTERTFPVRVRADLQLAIERLFQKTPADHFCGVRKQSGVQGMNFTDLLMRDRDDPALSVPPQFEEIEVGEEKPVRCLQSGLWLLKDGRNRVAVFLEPATPYARMMGIRFQIATTNKNADDRLTHRFFKHLEESVQQARCYRGKVLSLEWEQNYSGAGTGIKVHKLRSVERNQVILAGPTLELLDRNVIAFVERRPQLRKRGLATKKGLLFYGPPGTGKTHTIHYLVGALEGMTTLLISAEQVGQLGEYMNLARLLQPSMVVIEDADLIARDRTEMGGCDEVLLNKLLNEMDGLKEDADILFILTTNRPESLEPALASRPGRIDQAIEFPLPDRDGRKKLVSLYSRGSRLAKGVVEATVAKTEKVSAAFIKELMRRATQFQLERNDTNEIVLRDVESALDEILNKGGSLNRRLYGGKPDAALPNDAAD